MTYPQTGLPADQLHYPNGTEVLTEKVDQTSPTNIGFSLACVSAAVAMKFVSLSDGTQEVAKILSSIEKMMADPEVFQITGTSKGLFVSWIQPSTGKILKLWPKTGLPVIQKLSSVDNGWLVAFFLLTSAQFPELKNHINKLIEKIDLTFMYNIETGFFHGSCILNPIKIENWSYEVFSEPRILYLLCGVKIANSFERIVTQESKKNIFKDSTGRVGKSTWNGNWFELGWPHLLIPEYQFNDNWKNTYLATIQAQKDYGLRYNDGYYGYTAGMDPDGQYDEYRVPTTGENAGLYKHQPIITIAALLNIGMVEPNESYQEIVKIHQKFPQVINLDHGDGDSINIKTGAVQKDQIFPNQANNLLSCWNIIQNGEAQKLFMQTVSSTVTEIYKNIPLW